MENAWISTITVFLLTVAVFFLIVSRDWRIQLASLSILYGGVFALVLLSWPLSLALVKLVAGWMSGAILGMALVSYSKENQNAIRTDQKNARESQNRRSLLIFRILLCVLILMVVLTVTPKLAGIASSISPYQTYAGLLLLGMGLLHLSQSSEAEGVSLGLLVFLAGFETLYAAVETSTLLAGLLAGVNLGIALVGAYLITNQVEVEQG